jgi:F-type H+-transporting ATPase subunit b
MWILEHCASLLPVHPIVGAAMAGGGGVAIDFDRTVVLQMVLFSVLVVVLKPLLFDPMLRVFEERERRTDGARAEARAMQEQAGELLRKYEAELERIRRVAAQEREQARQETTRLEAEILRDGRETTTRILDEGRRRIDAELNAIRFELGQQSELLAQQAAARVLGREVN